MLVLDYLCLEYQLNTFNCIDDMYRWLLSIMAFVICFTIKQVLVYHDLLGMLQHPHYAKVLYYNCTSISCVSLLM